MQRRLTPAGRRTAVAALLVAVLVGFVVRESWAGRAITGDSLLFFVVVGVTLGSIYAVAATGLVVTYTTSGIFNFAQGAMGMFLAFVYWELKVNVGVQTFVALCLTVLVAAPVLGALTEGLFMRRLATAPLVAQLVVTIGLMLFLIGLAATIWDPNESRTIGTFFPDSSFFGSPPGGFNLGQTFIPWFRLITIVAGLLLAFGIRLLLYRTRLGIAMRAVVDDRDLAALNGASPARVAQASWALGTAMAALAGIFLAEELSALSIETLTLLMIDAFAAAIIGRLRSLPMTYVGGLLIGLSISFQTNFLDWSGRWSSAGQAVPTIILFLALLFLPQARISGRSARPEVAPRVPTPRRALVGFAALVGVVVVLVAVLGRPDVRMLGLALIFALIMLSLVPLIGWSGQISLAQITFVGIGAWAAVEFAHGGGQVFGLELVPVGSPVVLLIGAVAAVPIGILMALPALRLRGLYLALASLAFARLAEFVIFDQPEVFGGSGRRLGNPEVAGVDLTDPFTVLGVTFPQDAGLVVLTAVLFVVVGFLLLVLRRGPFGRRLIAMRDSPAACATLGVNLVATKVVVFGLSAAIAGFGGALLATLRGSAATANFQVIQGLPLVILVVVGGASVISGALLGGVLFQLPVLLVAKFGHIEVRVPALGTFRPLQVWNRLATGLLGFALGRQPDGIVPEVAEQVAGRRRRKADHRAPRSQPPEADGQPPPRKPSAVSTT